MNEDFSIPGEQPGRPGSICRQHGSSQPFCDIYVAVDGMPPMPGAVGPGIRLYGSNMEQLCELHAWVVQMLT